MGDVRFGIVEGEPGIFPDPIARFLRRIFRTREEAEGPPRGVADHPHRFQVSVLLHGQDYIDTLLVQDVEQIEVITWDDERWHSRLDATQAGWVHVRVASAAEAVERAGGVFVIEWEVYRASPDAISSLVVAALAEPDKRGAVSANLDPAILVWREDLLGTTARKGHAQATGVAIDRVGSAGIISGRWQQA